jgi:hypothetical protein
MIDLDRSDSSFDGSDSNFLHNDFFTSGGHRCIFADANAPASNIAATLGGQKLADGIGQTANLSLTKTCRKEDGIAGLPVAECKALAQTCW